MANSLVLRLDKYALAARTLKIFFKPSSSIAFHGPALCSLRALAEYPAVPNFVQIVRSQAVSKENLLPLSLLSPSLASSHGGGFYKNSLCT